jgi:signal transduction histidine kinase
MSSTNLTVYGGWILRSVGALLLFAVLRVFGRRYRKPYLTLWGGFWLASGVYTATAVAGHSLASQMPRALAARFTVSLVSGVAGYVQIALLLAGAGAFASRWPDSVRSRRSLLAASVVAGLAAALIATSIARSVIWKVFWRLSVRAGLAGLAFLYAGVRVFRARGPDRAIGPAALGVTLALSGLEQLHYFVIGAGQLFGLSFPYEPQLAVLDVFLVTAVGLGMVLCLLEEERDARREVQFQAVLAERSRLAREIHDTLAQDLVGISLQLESAAETLQADPVSARRHVDRARSLVHEGLTEARRSVWQLRHDSLEERGLAEALSSAVQERLGRPVPVHIRGSARRLSEEVESNLLRIGQEAVTNAAAHAGAKEIELELAYDADSVNLSVRDDGRGFDPLAEAAAGPGHFGLQGMRERTERLGGSFDVSSHPGRGTRIRVRVPVS